MSVNNQYNDTVQSPIIAQQENLAQEIIDTVVSLVARQFDKSFAVDDILDKKFDELSTEYLDKIEIVMRLEDHYSIQITDIEVDKLVFIRDFVQIVQQKK